MSNPEEQDENKTRDPGAEAEAPDLGTVQVDRGNETDLSPPRGHPYPIVGIGGSAGGLDAFTRLLHALPRDTGMAFVLVQHLNPHHESQLADILANATSMPVHTVADGMAVRPNEIFVIPPNTTMTLEDGVLRLSHRSPGLHLPVDAFFESLAHVQGGRAIAIVLSGNASDGSQGVKAVKAECGLTFAQDEATAQHVGMPRNAIATGVIDYVLSPEGIAGELVNLSRHPFVRPPLPDRADAEILPSGNGALKKVFHILRTGTKVDFTHYKSTTVRRRIGRRMIVRRTQTLAEYAQFLDEHPEEIKELYRDLLICVSHFFRDPEVFDALSPLLKDLLVSRNPGEPFRVWIPGCATGEEVYSLAITLKELAEDLQLPTPFQLFGTDVSDIALDRARSAVYPDIIAQDVSPERLQRFFARSDRGYQVTKAIRESCIFARQDLTNDPPFAHLDLISCRNLLIYLDSSLQRRILPVLHYSLNPTGLLVLGTAESIAAASDLFSAVDKRHHIYNRTAAPVRLTLNLGDPRSNIARQPTVKPLATLSGIDVQKKADLIIQSKYAPAAVVIDTDLRILHFRGRTGFYLEPPPGEANFHLIRMAREGLARPLRNALGAAASQNISIRETGIAVEYRGERREISIEITPIPGASPGERYFLVVFDDAGAHVKPETPAFVPGQPSDSNDYVASLETQIRGLQKEIGEIRESLRNANEDHEAHSEELRAANEEISSANEELQSTNEELGTTKEELQSANEELTTLNEELQNRNQELNIVNSDLLNLLSAVDVPFLMVDNEFRLRRFSAAAERVVNVKTIDIGHPLTHLQGRLDLSVLQTSIRSAVEELTVSQHDLQDKEGHWFSAAIRPYRTVDDRIAGAVIVLVDIHPLRQMLQAAEEARDYAEGMIATVREPLLVLDRDLRIQSVNSAFYDLFRVSHGETEGRLLYDLGNGQWNVPRLRELLGEALFRNQAFQDFEIEHDFPYLGPRRIRLNGRRIPAHDDNHPTVLLAIEDVTKRREEAEIRYQRLFETAKDAMLLLDASTGKLTDVNPCFLELTGFGREQLIGRALQDIQPFRGSEPAKSILKEAQLQEVTRHDGVDITTIDGRQVQADLVANRYAVGGQQIVQVNIRDVTQRNRAIQELRESEQRFRLFVDSVRDYALFQMDPAGRIISWNRGAERLLGYNESEILGQPGERLFTPEDVAGGEAARELEIAQAKSCAEDERWHIRKDGSRFFASGMVTTVRDESGQLRGFAKVMRDITGRKQQAEEQLKQQARLLELAQDLIIVRRLDGTISFWNRAAAETYGWSREEAAGKPIHDLLETVFPAPRAGIESALVSQGHWEGELVQTRRDHTRMIVWSRWALQNDSEGKPVGVLEINSDITERKRTDQQIRASLREKEVLLKEIHHRVKNNLQIIASLLSLQAEYLADANARAMLEEMNTRVRSIAAIHEMLYSAPNLSQIDFARYLNVLASDLTSIYSAQANGVLVEVDSGPVSLDITHAVPCGLIVSELVTNGFKHAFPNQQQGLIQVKFHCEDQECVLEISDNGIGLPASVEPHSAESMGLQLLNLLVQQLKGTLEIARESGTRFSIRFPQKPV